MPEIKIKDIEFNSEKIEKIYFEIEEIIQKIRKSVDFIEQSNLFNYQTGESEKKKALNILNDYYGDLSSLNADFNTKIEQVVRVAINR